MNRKTPDRKMYFAWTLPEDITVATRLSTIGQIAITVSDVEKALAGLMEEKK